MNPNGDFTTYPLTDAGNGERLAAKYGHDLKYVAAWKQWLWWTGTHWQKDSKKAIMVAAKETARSIRGEALSASPDIYAKVSTWAARSEHLYRLRAMVELAASERSIAREADMFDTSPWLLTCTNGTLDLRTGRVRPHSRDDLITRCLSMEYDPEAKCPGWHKFLERVQPPSDVRDYLQRAVGYSLSGSVEEQCLFFLHGVGANGKTTFLETLKSMLGDYSVRVQSRALLTKGWKSGAGPTPNIARLKGARMVVTSELESGGYLDESLVKDLTGGDSLVARYLHANLFEFRPTHKLWMCGNYKPGVRGVDVAIWRRIRLIPFSIVLPESEWDRQLMQKLELELAGILAWSVKGFRAWKKAGLGTPLGVVKATKEYKAEMDRLAGFVDACCTVGADLKVRTAHLHQVYCDWCRSNEMRPMNSMKFVQSLRSRGYAKAKKGGYSHILGLALKPGEW